MRYNITSATLFGFCLAAFLQGIVLRMSQDAYAFTLVAIYGNLQDWNNLYTCFCCSFWCSGTGKRFSNRMETSCLPLLKAGFKVWTSETPNRQLTYHVNPFHTRNIDLRMLFDFFVVAWFGLWCWEWTILHVHLLWCPNQETRSAICAVYVIPDKTNLLHFYTFQPILNTFCIFFIMRPLLEWHMR